MIKKLYDPDKNGVMQVVGLMSGSGSNLKKIIEFEKSLIEANGKAPYHVAVIFSDNPGSNAQAIGEQYNLPVLVKDIRAFYEQKKKPRTNMEVRKEFDRRTVYELTSRFELSAAAYAGYMSIASKPLIDAFIGVNVHPADLSKMQ
ncbi:MAG: hypothetical protein NT066_07135, partial [Candidatus Omnitrophica bacterium]|nr:hypothetical protein [Candidatus Omnitrophota bacterium]